MYHKGMLLFALWSNAVSHCSFMFWTMRLPMLASMIHLWATRPGESFPVTNSPVLIGCSLDRKVVDYHNLQQWPTSGSGADAPVLVCACLNDCLLADRSNVSSI
jgi:hypothetical protein